MISSKSRDADDDRRPETILVVERAEILRERLVRSLAEIPGVRVVAEAGSVEEALARLRRAPFDAVVVDVDVAAGDGFRALETLRRAAAGATLVVLGDDGDPEIRERCLQLGADAFLVLLREFDRIGEALRSLGTPGTSGARGNDR
jgi:DNA-binding NarL/FixJ family response regulator